MAKGLRRAERIRAAVICVMSLVSTLAGLALAAALGQPLWVEGEAWVVQRGSTGPDFKLAASGGELLGMNFGGRAGHFARWLIWVPGEVGGRAGAWALHIRYARAMHGPARFEVTVDGRRAAGSPAVFDGPTGGWGEDGRHFRWARVDLGQLEPGFHWLELRSLADGANTNIDGLLVGPGPTQPPGPDRLAEFLAPLLEANARGRLGYVWIEGEDWAEQRGSVGPDNKAAAAGGQVLGSNFGGGRDHWAEWRFVLGQPGLRDAALYIRYCRMMSGDVVFDIALDGRPAGSGTVVFRGSTGGWGERPEHFRIAQVKLGDLGPGEHSIRLAARAGASNLNIDGMFVAAGGFPLPDEPAAQVRLAEAFFISSQAMAAARMRAVKLPTVGELPRQTAASVMRLVRAMPVRTQRVLEALADKPWPNLVAAYDVTGTDYNNDLTWLDLRKERHFPLPHGGELGLIQPHMDFYVLPRVQVGGRTVGKWRAVLHVANALVYRADLGSGTVEVAFLVMGSRRLVVRVTVSNGGGRALRVRVAQYLHHPRAVRPPQRFGRLIPCRTGAVEWAAVDRDKGAVLMCCREYVPGGRRPAGKVVVCLATDDKPQAMGFVDEPGDAELAERPAATCGAVREMTVGAGESAAAAFAVGLVFFNEQRDVAGPRGTVTYGKMRADQAAAEAFRQARAALTVDWQDFVRRSLRWYRRVPLVNVPHRTWARDFYTALELPRCETLSPHGNMPVPFYNFCRAVGNNLYQWWSYGMHGHESLACFVANITDPGLSESFLRGHFAFQNEDGGVPYGVSPASRPGKKTGTATMPALVWEAWEAYLWSGDRGFLEMAYEAGRRYHDWWIKARDRTGEGLVHWRDFMETVRDDRDVPTWLLSGGAEYQEALDLNCYILVQERCLAAMARELGRQEEARQWQAAADRRVRLMNAYMWDEQDGCYYGINEVVPQVIDIMDCSTFFPLWAGLAPLERAEKLVGLLKRAEKFWLAYPVPSVARDEPLWGADWHWHGPNWVQMVWPTVRGLRDYGYFELAAELAYRNCEMVFTRNLEADGHFREYYNPLTGKGARGCLYDYIWASIPAAMVVEAFAGVRPRADGLEVMPALPRDWDHLRLEGLIVRGRRVSVQVTRRDAARRAVAAVNGRSVPVYCGRGVFIPWAQLRDGTRVDIVQPWKIAEQHGPPVALPELGRPVPPHEYPEDRALIERVRKAMTTKEKLRQK